MAQNLVNQYLSNKNAEGFANNLEESKQPNF